jgi:hypothetical protein
MLLSPTFTDHCQGQLLLSRKNHLSNRLLGFHHLCQYVPEHFDYELVNLYSVTHHIFPTLLWDIQFGLFRFRSPLLTESLVDFSSSSYSDASLRTVRSPKLKHGSSWRGLIRTSWNQRSHAPTPGLSQLATSFFAYQAESSSNRRHCTSTLPRLDILLVLILYGLREFQRTM